VLFIANHLFQIHELTTIKVIWICLFFVAWVCDAGLLWKFRNNDFSTIFLRIYLSLWLFDLCKYQSWWTWQYQFVMDVVLILAVLETLVELEIILQRKDIFPMLLITFIWALTKNYPGISKLVYFSHMYTLGVSSGALLDSVIRNIRIGYIEPCSIGLFIWVSSQLAASTANKSWWFIVGITKLFVQICCLILWHSTLNYKYRKIHA